MKNDNVDLIRESIDAAIHMLKRDEVDRAINFLEGLSTDIWRYLN